MAERIGWKAGDGTLFPTKKAADQYEAEQVVKEFFGDRADEILKNADRIIPALRMSPDCTLNKRRGRKSKENGAAVESGTDADTGETERRVPRGKAAQHAAA